MILIILSHTPVGVWGLLATLMVLGFSQTRQRRWAPLRRLMLMLMLPLALLKSTRAPAAALPRSSLRWSAGRGKPLSP